MTGTAKTEEREFRDIYGLDVVVMPTNRAGRAQGQRRHRLPHREGEVRSGRRRDHRRAREGPAGARRHALDREVASGSRCCCGARGVECNVLNAKYHEQEAQIIKDAGQRGAVTIATNMAGRGIDIKLGEGVAGVGGLHIIGTERHESRRIDNQLRGRAGRQGDPGFDALLHLARRRSDAPLRCASACQTIMDFVEVHRRDADRSRASSRARSRTRSRRSRTTTTRSANTFSNTTT